MVRRATLEDARAIAHVHVLAWRAAYEGIAEQERIAAQLEQRREEGWRRRIADPAFETLVAEEQGAAVGFATFGPGREAGSAEISYCYVLPERWGRGVGRALVGEAERRLWQQGFGRVTLWVLERNLAARRFYERVGFAPDGARRETRLGGPPLVELRYAKERPGSPG